MENGVSRGPRQVETQARAVARDALDAILLAEGAMVQVLDAGRPAGDVELPGEGHNAFGDRVVLEPEADPVARVRRAAERVAAGERVGLIATAGELVLARSVMVEMAAQRLGAVFHAVEPVGVEAALALSDVGWGLLFASDVEESLDLTLVARRAAEDCGTPVLVVHEVAHVRRVEPLAALTAPFVEAFVGAPATHARRLADPAHLVHAQIGPRAFADRVPFALGSALRELEALTGRRRDLLTRSPVGQGADASLMLVGMGALGDVLLGEVPRLRAAGHDVGAVKVTAFRPFPGPRAIRLLARSLAVTVLEQTDRPLAQSNALTCELKAAFADAITWAPEYPGVGRVPRVHSGVVRAAAHDLEAHDLDAIVRNMQAGDQAKRWFILGGDASVGLAPSVLPPPPTTAESPVFHMRGLHRDVAHAATAAELVTAVVARVLSLRVRAAIRPLPPGEGGGFAFDLVAAPQRPLGVHLASALALVAIDDASSLLEGNPLARLGRAGTVAVPSHRRAPEAVWRDMPPYVKAIVFDRDARVVGWEPPVLEGLARDDEARWLTAGAFAGVAFSVLAPHDGVTPRVDPSLLEREVIEAVELIGSGDALVAARAGAAARRAFEACVLVPRAVVEGDEAAIRLGRQDARSASFS